MKDSCSVGVAVTVTVGVAVFVGKGVGMAVGVAPAGDCKRPPDAAGVAVAAGLGVTVAWSAIHGGLW